jgi:hypothetical protein
MCIQYYYDGYKACYWTFQLTSLIVLSIRTDRLGDRRYLHHHSLHYLGRHQFDAHRIFYFLNATEQLSRSGSDPGNPDLV